MPSRSPSVWARFAVAAISIVVATGARWLLSRVFSDAYPFAPIFLAVVFSAWYGGFGPAIFAAVLGIGTTWLLPDTRPGSGHAFLGLLFYVVFSLGIASLGGLMARARQRIAGQIDELTRQREQLAATLSSIGDAVIVTDAAGQITSLNPIAESLTRWTAAEAVGRPLEEVFQIINEETRAAAESPVSRVLERGTICGPANHAVLIAKDGSERSIDDSAAPIKGSSGQMAGVVLVFRDTTERRERERLLRESDRRKDEFLAVLAHELRNPLAPIASALQILKLPKIDVPTAAEARDVAERQLTHLTRLVDDLLDVSRIMRGKVELRKERVELATIIARAVETARPLIDGEHHELAVSLPSEPVWLEADLVRLAQVLANLLSNAAKYTERGGQIGLAAVIEGGAVVIRIRDSGIGIDPETLPRLFEMFMQVAPGASRSQGGLGIGLTLVKNLVAMHGGTIEAHSAGLGQGSEFVVRLPAILAEPPEATPSEREAGATERRRILVVDDNADAAQSLAMLLKLRGHEVQVALGGAEALTFARLALPELVFLDIGMPGMDGYEVARQLRAEFNSSLTIIALTGWGADQDRQRSRAAGFDRHLTKPVDLAALEAALEAPPNTNVELQMTNAGANEQ